MILALAALLAVGGVAAAASEDAAAPAPDPARQEGVAASEKDAAPVAEDRTPRQLPDEAEIIPGTAWTPRGPWPAPARARLTTLAARLPARLREAPVRLRWSDAPELPEDLTTPHTVVRVHGGSILVGGEGLETQIAAWAARATDAPDGSRRPEPRREVGALFGGAAELADALLERQLIHALVERTDAEAGWSRAYGWTRLSGWQGAGPPAEEDVASFATPYGRKSAREDLATAAERYLAPALPGDIPGPPGCRIPSKWAFLQARLGEPAEVPSCADLADVGLDPDAIEAVEILYARASARTPASLVGHLLLGLVYAATPTSPARTDVYELVAITGDEARGSPRYVLRGLTGGFGSEVQRVPIRFAVLRYARENRGVVRFRLRLDDAQERALLTRLDELRQGWKRRYLFLTRNCTHLPKELVEAALDTDLGLPDVYGPDALLGELARRDLLELVPAGSLEEHSAADRADAADTLRRALVDAVVAAHPQLAGPLATAVADTRAPRPADRARGYAALTEIGAGAPHVRADLLRYLAWSDQVENLRFVRVGGPRPAGDPAVEALWSGLGWLRKLESARPRPDPSGDLPLMRALAASEPRGGTHTPLLRTHAAATLSGAPDSLEPGVVIGSVLYGFEMGEARRFGAAAGTAIQLLPWELGVGGDGVRGRLAVLRMMRVLGNRPAANLGFYADLAQVDFRDRASVVPLDAGAVVELLQGSDHRHHLGLRAGLAVGGADLGATDDPGWRGTFATPVRAFGRVASGTHALTALAVDATWTPTWTVDQRWSTVEGHLAAGLHLGELDGVDIGFFGDYRVGTQLSSPAIPGHAVRLGLVFEPF